MLNFFIFLSFSISILVLGLFVLVHIALNISSEKFKQSEHYKNISSEINNLTDKERNIIVRCLIMMFIPFINIPVLLTLYCIYILNKFEDKE